MKQLLIQLALAIFETLLLLYAVIMHEPPAFVAHLFGIVTGLSWALPFLWHWVRQDKEHDGRD